MATQPFGICVEWNEIVLTEDSVVAFGTIAVVGLVIECFGRILATEVTTGASSTIPSCSLVVIEREQTVALSLTDLLTTSHGLFRRLQRRVLSDI